MDKQPDHLPILQTAFGFWPSKVLLTAVELGVFTRLGNNALGGEELGASLGLHPRGIWDFLDSLVAMGLLARDGDGKEATYRNTEATSVYLDKTSDRYLGGILEMLNARLYRFWDNLPEALQTGQPQNEIKHSQKSIFEELYDDPIKLEGFLEGMTGLSRLNFEAFARKFDLSNYATLCDVGGATGLLSILVAQQNPHLKCTSFDLPAVEAIATKKVAAKDLSDQISVASGDFFQDPLPKAEVVTMGMILHDWNLEKKKQLIRAAYQALPEDGAFVAIENLIDDARRENLFGLLMSLNMLIEFGEAFDFTGADFRNWCQEAGFRRFEVLHLSSPCSAAVAYK